MINAISDLETDAANAEIKAVATSPWPSDMREQVWSDRVRLRVKMKKEMSTHDSFWRQHGQSFGEWFVSLEPNVLKKVFQIPRSEVVERVNTHYGIHSAFGTVLSAVTEQVAHFQDTKYPTDGRGISEIAFEQALCYDRRGGFMLRIVDKVGTLQEDMLKIWLNRMASLGGPVLLERTPRKCADDVGADDAEEQIENAAKPSFRMDRRIVRLLIARYWATALMEKYSSTHAVSEVNEEATADGLEGNLLIEQAQGDAAQDDFAQDDVAQDDAQLS